MPLSSALSWKFNGMSVGLKVKDVGDLMQM